MTSFAILTTETALTAVANLCDADPGFDFEGIWRALDIYRQVKIQGLTPAEDMRLEEERWDMARGLSRN